MSDNEKKVEQKIVGTISKEDLGMLNLRRDIISDKKTELALLQNETENYLNFLRDKYKLELGKEFVIDNDGKIIETIQKSDS